MIRATETHNVFALGVVTRQPNRLHHRFGARHVERHFIHARYSFQSFSIAGRAGVVRPQHKAQVLGFGHAFGHGFFVEINSKHIHAIRACQVVERLAIQVGDMHAAGRLQKRPHLEVLLDQGAELEGHAVGRDELHVRNVLAGGRCGLNAQRVAGFENFGEFEKCLATKILYVKRCVVTFKELLLVKMVARQQTCQTLGHSRVSGQRRVLGAGQLKPSVNRGRQGSQCAQTHPSGVHSQFPNVEDPSFYSI